MTFSSYSITRATYRTFSEIPKNVLIRQIHIQSCCLRCGVKQEMTEFDVPVLSDRITPVNINCQECGRKVDIQHITVIGIPYIDLPMMTDYVYLPKNKPEKKITSRWEIE